MAAHPPTSMALAALAALLLAPPTPSSAAPRAPVVPSSAAPRAPLVPSSAAPRAPLVPSSAAPRAPLVPSSAAPRAPLRPAPVTPVETPRETALTRWDVALTGAVQLTRHSLQRAPRRARDPQLRCVAREVDGVVTGELLLEVLFADAPPTVQLELRSKDLAARTAAPEGEPPREVEGEYAAEDVTLELWDSLDLDQAQEPPARRAWSGAGRLAIGRHDAHPPRLVGTLTALVEPEGGAGGPVEILASFDVPTSCVLAR